MADGKSLSPEAYVHRPLVDETQQILTHSSSNVPEPPLEPEVAELNPTTVK